MPAPPPPPGTPPRRTASGLLARVVLAHDRVRDELAARGPDAPPAPPGERPTPVPDPVHLAATLIVARIRRDRPELPDAAHVAYVEALIRQILEPPA